LAALITLNAFELFITIEYKVKQLPPLFKCLYIKIQESLLYAIFCFIERSNLTNYKYFIYLLLSLFTGGHINLINMQQLWIAILFNFKYLQLNLKFF